jgi:D-methionine transport system ATP-binding protein
MHAHKSPVVLLRGVRKVYRSGGRTVEALAGVDLTVPRGSIQGVIGFSGAGKSTLLRCISRLEKPDAGSVVVAGSNLSQLDGADLREARRQIGVVFQHLNLLQSKTVFANIALPLELSGRLRPEIRTRVTELLDWFGLQGKESQYPAQLSGGQKQRVAIARALAMQPAVLLTDEPTSALDPETTASVLALLRRVQQDFQVTVLLITHELDAVRAICDRVAVLDAGKVAEEGTVEQVLLQPASSAAKRLIHRESGSIELSAFASASSTVLELQLLGSVATEPVLHQLGQVHGVEVNILRGHIGCLNATAYGFLLVQLNGPPQAVTAAIMTLRQRGIGVTEASSADE